MATPPFNIAETTPQSSDVVLNYPGVERTYRDVVESWLTMITDPTTGLLKAAGFPATLSIAGTALTIGAVTATSLLAAGRPFTQQLFPVGATWTRPTGVLRAIFEAVAGGGGGGGVDGQGAGTGGAGGGGASGFYGMTPVLDVSAVVSAVVTLGAAGAAGSAGGGDGGTGGNTTITIGATTYTWFGGTGGGGMIAGGTIGGSQDGGAASTGTNVVGFSQPGGIGVYNGNGATNSTGGNGASSPFGSGGKGQHLIIAGNSNGFAAAGFGGGGGGGTTNNSVNNATGGLGTSGYMRVWEIY